MVIDVIRTDWDHLAIYRNTESLCILKLIFMLYINYILEKSRDFPGGPVVKTLHFQHRGHEFNPWSGKIHMPCGQKIKFKKKKKKKKMIYERKTPT